MRVAASERVSSFAVLPKVDAGCSIDAVGQVGIGIGINVPLENLLFVIEPRELQRNEDLLYLAGVADLKNALRMG